MAKTEVILTANVENLGAESDQVMVSAGYARNFLIPQGKAIPLTRSNSRRLAALRQRRAEREASELEHMQELSASLAHLVLPIRVKTGDDGKLFGSVTAQHIIDDLSSLFEIEMDRKKVNMSEPIRSLGEHMIDLHLHTDIHAQLKVVVESTNPVVQEAKKAAAEAAAAEAAASE